MNLGADSWSAALSQPPLPDERRRIQEYIEQAQATLQSQRASIEFERFAFVEERKLWTQEREILKSRIASLERFISCCTNADMSSLVPVPHAEGSARVWEGSRPTGRPTREFLDGACEQSPDLLFSEKSPSLDEALSPRSQPLDRPQNFGIPVELVDNSLDGITLKSTGLPPDVAAKLGSPLSSNFSSPPLQNRATAEEGDESRHSYRMHYQCEISLLASHLGPIQEAQASLSEERPKLTSHSTDTQQPNFTPDMDSPEAEMDEDPELTGPLTLLNDEVHDLGFLEALDKKLLMEAQRAVTKPALSDSDALSETSKNAQPESEPEIRFKKSTNFGTAFGSTQNDDCFG